MHLSNISPFTSLAVPMKVAFNFCKLHFVCHITCVDKKAPLSYKLQTRQVISIQMLSGLQIK